MIKYVLLTEAVTSFISTGSNIGTAETSYNGEIALKKEKAWVKAVYGTLVQT